MLSFSLLKKGKIIKVEYLLPQICQVDRPYQEAQLSQETQHQAIRACLVILVDLWDHPFHRGRPAL